MKRSILLLFLLVSILPNSIFSQSSDNEPYVILVSFDAFRYDYPDLYDLPTFKMIREKGSYAKGLKPIYPSKTFPNHYSIITGLYAENHGLVDNRFYNPSTKEIYKIRDRSKVEDPKFYGGLPLWQLVQENGMLSASYYWVGSEAPVTGSYPDYYHIFNSKIPDSTRVDGVLDWLKLPKTERPRFISLYFECTDTQGHRTGPNSDEMAKVAKHADDVLRYLLDELKNIPLSVNVIVVSDHGMKEVIYNKETFIFLDKIFETSDTSLIMANNSTHAHLYLDDKSKVDSLFELIKKNEFRFLAYKKEDIPQHYHYKNNDRIGDILLVAHAPYQFKSSTSSYKNQEENIGGNHGWDPYTTPEMDGVLYAIGPNIKEGKVLEVIQNIHVYPLVTKILNIRNPEIDGKWKKVSKLYRKSS